MAPKLVVATQPSDPLDLVARKTVLATNSLCAAVNYYSLGVEAFNQVKETPVMAHADEFETSLYLHLAGDWTASAQGRAWGGALNSLALLAFVLYPRGDYHLVAIFGKRVRKGD